MFRERRQEPWGRVRRILKLGAGGGGVRLAEGHFSQPVRRRWSACSGVIGLDWLGSPAGDTSPPTTRCRTRYVDGGFGRHVFEALAARARVVRSACGCSIHARAVTAAMARCD